MGKSSLVETNHDIMTLSFLLEVVQNLKTGDYLKNLVANILVTHNSSGQFSNFRFSNITVPGAQFSVKYLFQDTGIFEIIRMVSATYVVDVAIQKYELRETKL